MPDDYITQRLMKGCDLKAKFTYDPKRDECSWDTKCDGDLFIAYDGIEELIGLLAKRFQVERPDIYKNKDLQYIMADILVEIGVELGIELKDTGKRY